VLRAAIEARASRTPCSSIIVVAGASGSGKTHFAKELLNFLPGSTVISLDNYMRREKVPPPARVTFLSHARCGVTVLLFICVFIGPDALQVAEDNFDDPNLLDFDLLLKNMTEIQGGSGTQTPVYSFSESKRTGFVTTPVPHSKVLIVEGTYALKELLRPVYDLAISVTGSMAHP